MPAQSAGSKALDLFITQTIAPVLRQRGFRRRARSFSRTHKDLYHCVHVQAWKWNTPTEAQFTINLLVIWPRWHEVWTGKPCPANPVSAAPVAQDRVGTLVYGQDRYWMITPGTESRQVAEEVVPALTQACDQFFPAFGSSADVLARLDRGGELTPFLPAPLIHVTLLVAAGRLTEAQRYVVELVNTKPDWHIVTVVAQRLALSGAT